MKKTIYFLIVVFLSACGGTSGTSSTPQNPNGPFDVPGANVTPNVPDCSVLYDGPAEVCRYVQNFVADAIVNHRDVVPDMANPKLTIQISSLAQYGPGVIGLCEAGVNLRRITFDPSYWNDAQTQDQKEILSHHELGHCVLYRPHTSLVGAIPDSIDTVHELSIMYPFIIDGALFDDHRPYYHSELFFQADTVDPSSPSSSFNRANLPPIEICNGIKNAITN